MIPALFIALAAGALFAAGMLAGGWRVRCEARAVAAAYDEIEAALRGEDAQ